MSATTRFTTPSLFLRAPTLNDRKTAADEADLNFVQAYTMSA